MSVSQVLATATSRIESRYFELPIAGQAKPKLRERVYCYELYHQLRIALANSLLTLTAEPDKRGRIEFSGINPDLIIHDPGNNRCNQVAIEVECTPSLRHISKDFKNLRIMRENGYQQLFLLFFGCKQPPFSRLREASRRESIDTGEISFLWHSNVGSAATAMHLTNSDQQ